MALHFKLCILSFKPQIIITTKAQLSHSFNPAKLDSLHIAIKWKIVQEERSTALLTKIVCPNFNHTSTVLLIFFLLELENDNKHARTHEKNISRTSRVELIVFFLWQGDLSINH